MSLYVDLYFILGKEKHKVLAIPRDQFVNYTFRPLKWLRFVGYAIFGAEGDIYEMEGNRPVLYDSVTDAAQMKDSYIFQSSRDPHLVDMSFFDCRNTVTSSASSTVRDNFRGAIRARDGRCVLTRADERNEAYHILPLSKTDSYMKAVTEARKKDDADVIESVNDNRNGVMLNAVFHPELRSGHITFLVTPNFALDTADVPKSTPFRLDTDRDLDLPSDDGPRYTAHLFPGFSRINKRFVPLGADAYFPGPPSNNPSSLILDFRYGCLAFQAWGQPAFRSFIEQETDEIYYSQMPKHRPLNERTKSEEDYARWERKELRRSKRRSKSLDRAFDVMFVLTKLRLKERQEQYEANKEEIEAYLRQQEREEREASIAKVNDWRQGVLEDIEDRS